MKKIGLLLALCYFVSLSAQKGTAFSIEGLEKQRFEAMCKKDIAFLENIADENLVYIHSNALIESKKDFISSIQTGKIVYEKMDLEEVTTRRFDKNIAILNGIVHVNGQLNGNAFEVRLRFTDVYVKQGKSWKWENWQSTKIP
jgi:hypothetical protein